MSFLSSDRPPARFLRAVLVQLNRVEFVTLVIVAFLLGFGLLTAAVVGTPYLGDDIANKDIRIVMLEQDRSVVDLVIYYTGWWVDYAGRFFPGSLTWSFFLFYIFDLRSEYKLVLVVVIGAAITAVAALVVAVAKSRRAGAIVAFLMLGTLQIRAWYDGLISYSGLLPVTTALTLGATALLIRRRGIGWAILAGAAYMYALLTYETVLLFAPVMIAIVILTTRSWKRALPVAIPAVIQIIITLSLRAYVGSNTPPAYTVNLEPGIVLWTFFKQAIAAIPLSQWWLHSEGVPRFSSPLVVLCILIVGIPVFLAIRTLGSRALDVPRWAPLALGIFGVWIWLSSSAVIAVTVRWQGETPLGQGYLGVVYGYAGIALLLAAIWLAGNRRFAPVFNGEVVESPARRASTIWGYGSAAAIALMVTLTTAGNLTIVS